MKRAVIAIFFAEMIALGIQYYDLPQIYWEFNVFEIASTSSILLLYAIIFLVLNFEKAKHNYFYFCAGLIIYLSSSCIIFLSGNTDLVLFTEPFFFDIWIFNSLFYILYQFLIFKEWKHLNKKQEEITSEEFI